VNLVIRRRSNPEAAWDLDSLLPNGNDTSSTIARHDAVCWHAIMI